MAQVRNIKEWIAEMGKFERLVTEHGANTQKNVAIDAITWVVPLTPVDTGAARGNWHVSLNNADGAYDLSKTDKDGAPTINSGVSLIKAAPRFADLIIENNVPYIDKLEDGHSKQAPNGMVGLTFNAIIAKYQR